MQVIIRDTQPPPPLPKEVIITMTIIEARELHNACYARAGARVDGALGPLHRLNDALTAAGVNISRK